MTPYVKAGETIRVTLMDGTSVTAIAKSMRVETQAIEVTTFGDLEQKFISGPQTMSLELVLVGPVVKGEPLQVTPEVQAEADKVRRGISLCGL